MDKEQRVRYESLLRSRDFGVMHEDRFPKSSKGGQVFDVVAEVVAQIEREEAARLAARDEGYHAGKARTELRRWMLDIVATSRDLARDGAPGVVPLKMPTRANEPALLAAASRFLEAGASFSDELASRGLGENWATSYKAAIDAFAAHQASRRNGRYSISASRASIDAAFKRGSNALRTLDGIVAIVLRGDEVLLTAWQRCRKVVQRKTTEAAVDVPSDTVPTAAPADTHEDPLKQAS